MDAHSGERAKSRAKAHPGRTLLDCDPRHRSAGKYAMRPPDSRLGARDGVPLHQPGLQGSLEEAGEPRPVPVDGCATEGPARGRLSWPRWRSSSTRSSWDGVIALSQWSPSRDTSQVISVRMVLYDRPLQLRPWQVRVLRYWRNVTRVAAWAGALTGPPARLMPFEPGTSRAPRSIGHAASHGHGYPLDRPQPSPRAHAPRHTCTGCPTRPRRVGTVHGGHHPSSWCSRRG